MFVPQFYSRIINKIKSINADIDTATHYTNITEIIDAACAQDSYFHFYNFDTLEQLLLMYQDVIEDKDCIKNISINDIPQQQAHTMRIKGGDHINRLNRRIYTQNTEYMYAMLDENNVADFAPYYTRIISILITLDTQLNQYSFDIAISLYLLGYPEPLNILINAAKKQNMSTESTSPQKHLSPHIEELYVESDNIPVTLYIELAHLLVVNFPNICSYDTYSADTTMIKIIFEMARRNIGKDEKNALMAAEIAKLTAQIAQLSAVPPDSASTEYLAAATDFENVKK